MSLKNYQYDVIIHQLDMRRLHAKYMLDKRTEEIYNKCPEILDIDNQIAIQSAERARRAIMGDDTALQGLAEANRALAREKETILVKNGYPADYLSPRYECSLCKDTGYVNGERCSCFNKAVSNLIYSESNVREIIREENFDNFNYELYSDVPDQYDVVSGTMRSPRDLIRDVVALAHDFIDGFDTEYHNLLIYGNTGVGKTFLSNCIAKELLDRSHSVLYYTAFRFFKYMGNCKFSYDAVEDRGSLSEDYLVDCDLLILDDIGTELSNSFTNSALYTVINERHLKRRPTIISTNLSLAELEKRYSERIFSRLSKDYSLLKIVGSDIRRK